MTTPIISVQKVNKRFLLPHIHRTTLREHLFSLFRKTSYEEYHALHDVSFDVEKGDFLGIVGRNGCGKSTLLKILAGVYTADSGTVDVRGTVAPFLELGVGFQGELTARENIFLNGAMLGMSRQHIESCFDEILAFAELERFVDSKLKNFSSGMVVRLAFSIAVRAKADILILDEVLAVGDVAFQEKCFAVFEQLKKEGTTIILVSHGKESIERFCTKALLLDHGNIVAYGTPKQVLYEYQHVLKEDASESNAQSNDDLETRPGNKERWGDSKVIITDIQLKNVEGKDCSVFETGSSMTIDVHYTVKEPIKNATFAVAVLRQGDQLYCYDINTHLDQIAIPSLQDDGKWSLTFPSLPLLRGQYYLKIGIFSDGCAQTHDFFDVGPQWTVTSPDNTFGAVMMEHTWTMDVSHHAASHE